MTTEELHVTDQLARLRAIAQAATDGPWTESQGVAGRVLRMFPSGPVVVAECGAFFENAEHIATFDPVLVAAMLDVVEAAEMFGTSHEIRKALVRFREVAG